MSKTEQEILDEYDDIFEIYHDYQGDKFDIEHPPPVAVWGLQCGSGWFDLIDDLCADLRAIDPDIKAHQVKEKFGGLRFYTGGTSKEALDRIQEAADESVETCEYCSNPGERTNNGWIRTLCGSCERQLQWQRHHDRQNREA